MTNVLQSDRYGRNSTCHSLRWVRRAGAETAIRFEALFPEVQKSARCNSNEEQDLNCEERSVNLKRARSETDKGALFHEYDLLTHQFIAHIRRIHPGNNPIECVAGKCKMAVNAADPLDAPGVLFITS